jgi:hypothetical protein
MTQYTPHLNLQTFFSFYFDIIYSGASVHEINPFLEAVRETKCS